MLKFFRRKRLKLIKQRNLKKYLIYAIGEVTLVVIGILLALQVNNWNQAISNEKIQKNYLARIQLDISKDIKEITRLKENYKKRATGIRSFLKYFDRPKIPKDTFNTYYWLAHHADDFSPHRDTYFELINTGKLDLISNEQLKLKILDLYSYYNKIDRFEDHISEDNREWIYNLSIKLFDYEKALKGSDDDFDETIKEVYSNIQLKNAFGMSYLSSLSMVDFFSESLVKINKLDSLIHIELK